MTIPADFQTRFPSLSAALMLMLEPPSDRTRSDASAIESDLVAVNAGNEALEPLTSALLAGTATPEIELARISSDAYRWLGVSEHVRVFMGRLWATAAREWSANQRKAFLEITTTDRHGIFQALDFTPTLLAQVPFSASEVLHWLKRARERVGDDLIQH